MMNIYYNTNKKYTWDKRILLPKLNLQIYKNIIRLYCNYNLNDFVLRLAR